MSFREYWNGYGMMYYGIGMAAGAMLTLAGMYVITDIDRPVANEPKCETIIIHRR